MPGGQKSVRKLGHHYARGAMTWQNPETLLPGVHYECLKFGARFCPVCINVPQIWGITMPGGAMTVSKLRQIIARCA